MNGWKKGKTAFLFIVTTLIFPVPLLHSIPYDPVIALSKESPGSGRINVRVENEETVNCYHLFRGILGTPFAYAHDEIIECFIDGTITDYLISDDQFDGVPYYYILAASYDSGEGCILEYGVDSELVERPPSRNECPPVECDAGEDGMRCEEGDPVTLGGDPVAWGGSGDYTIDWLPPDDLDLSDPLHPEATPSSSTSYTLRVTDNVTGCRAEDEVLVEVPPPLEVDAGMDQHIICEVARLGGNPTASGGSGDYSYWWRPAGYIDDPSSPNPLADPDMDILFVVTVTDNRTGCEERDGVMVTVGSPGTECGVTIDWGVNVGECASEWGPSPLMDQDGDMVDMYDYECDVLLLVLGPMW